MPIAIAMIALVAIVFGTIMIATIAKAFFTYLSSRHQADSPPESLTTSELQALIQDAVEEATQPLVERLEALEERASAAPLPPAHTGLLDDAEDYAETAANIPHRQAVR